MAEETLDLLDTRATIRPDSTETFGDQALDALRALGDRSSGLVLGETLGKGGMGLVRVGEQRSVGRPVAIKTLRPGVDGDDAALSLLREGWVTGRLEHPNVVPVYDVGTDAAGRPFLVLKRIDGAAWTSFLADANAIPDAPDDVVEWHLRVLLAVTDAVRFAHDRGVIHRDLKPDNVMVGRFGEVYLLDWGIAAALTPDPSGRLPRRKGLCGSPAYMAPEMFAADEPTVAMDVYLLGGLLHEVLYGEPPHRAKGLAAAREASQRACARARPDEPELSALCARALDPDPAVRPESADAFARSLRLALEHRDSLRVARRADDRSEEMKAAREPETRRRLFAEARFGWQQALELWPDNPHAKAAMRDAATHIARWELAQGAPARALALLAEHPDLDPEVAAAVRAAQAEAEAEKARLARMLEDQDAAVGQRTRVFLTAVFGVAFIVFPLIAWWLQARMPTPNVAVAGATWSGIVLVMVAGLAVWARDSMSKSQINRTFIRLMIAVPVGQFALSVGAALYPIPLEQFLRQNFLVWSAMCLACGAAVDARILGSAAIYLVAWYASARFPELTLPIMSLADAVFAANLLALWAPGTEGFLRGDDEGA